MDITTLDIARYAPALFVAELVAIGFWLAALLAVRSLCARAKWMADVEEVGRLASGLFARFAWLGLVLALLAGAARVYAVRAFALHDRVTWIAIGLFVVMLFLHAFVGGRASRLARYGLHVPRRRGRVATSWSSGELPAAE